MKRFLILPVLFASLALAGCGTTGGGTTTTLPPEVQNTINEVTAATKQACSYEPTVATISNILSGIGVPYVGMVAGIADQICSVVTKLGARRGGRHMMTVRHAVTGEPRAVEIKGRFVR